MNNQPGYIVCIGTSAGGFTALVELVAQLKPHFNAAYFIVLHLSAKSISGFLAHRLQQNSQLKCVLPTNGMPIERGTAYVAVPNHHLLMNNTSVVLGHGPTENRWRPSVDLLFRTAAAHFNSRTIGIVLTGLLNDGTSGLSSIKRCGGITVVQDPNEAEYPDMPLSAMNAVQIDHVVSLGDMGMLLEELTKRPLPEKSEVPEDIRVEAMKTEKVITKINTEDDLHQQTFFTCPDCGGALWQHDDDAILKFKCHIGHSYTLRDLMLKQKEETENSLWYAIRSMEQRKEILSSLGIKYEGSGNRFMAEDYKKRVVEIEQHIENIKRIISLTLDHPEE